ncbi:hypothetical protein [Flavobacterium sp.]|uniref:hypothetical protein n=1 Tax=Flavobacterium sp. TaxID=239 RepID=UPI0026098783|nr:hypothetical protein [Flavobacterium sp.]
MIVLVLKYLTPKGFRGITVFPFVFVVRKEDKKDTVFLNHEKIHIRQQLELVLLPFFIWYGIEFLIRWRQYGNRHTAYRNISFEREAYANEANPDYLSKRPFWHFIKYLKKK